MAIMTKENVEEVIAKAIDKYYKKGMVADAMFWATAIRLLKEKLEEEVK